MTAEAKGDAELPDVPGREKRDQNIRFRVSADELRRLKALRRDHTEHAIAMALVLDCLAGRYRPHWADPQWSPEAGGPAAPSMVRDGDDEPGDLDELQL